MPGISPVTSHLATATTPSFAKAAPVATFDVMSSYVPPEIMPSPFVKLEGSYQPRRFSPEAVGQYLRSGRVDDAEMVNSPVLGPDTHPADRAILLYRRWQEERNDKRRLAEMQACQEAAGLTTDPAEKFAWLQRGMSCLDLIPASRNSQLPVLMWAQIADVLKSMPLVTRDMFKDNAFLFSYEEIDAAFPKNGNGLPPSEYLASLAYSSGAEHASRMGNTEVNALYKWNQTATLYARARECAKAALLRHEAEFELRASMVGEEDKSKFEEQRVVLLEKSVDLELGYFNAQRKFNDLSENGESASEQPVRSAIFAAMNLCKTIADARRERWQLYRIREAKQQIRLLSFTSRHEERMAWYDLAIAGMREADPKGRCFSADDGMCPEELEARKKGEIRNYMTRRRLSWTGGLWGVFEKVREMFSIYSG